MRSVDIDGAIEVLNLRGTTPDDFIVKPTPIAAQPGAMQSVRSNYFNIDHLHPTPAQAIVAESHQPNCLHVLVGAIELRDEKNELLETLERGESAMIVEPLRRYSVVALTADVHVVRVDLP
jgi:hypothetical protein